MSLLKFAVFFLTMVLLLPSFGATPNDAFETDGNLQPVEFFNVYSGFRIAHIICHGVNPLFDIKIFRMRQYARNPGTRHYRNYQPETLERILNEIRTKKISVRAAAQKYEIHRNVLSNKLKNKAPKKPGGQTVFTEDEELAIVAHLITLSTYGFPVNKLELRFIVKSYLDKQGRTVEKFKINVPGIEWANSFLNDTQSKFVILQPEITTICKEMKSMLVTM